MPIDLTEHNDFLARSAKYRADKAAAVAGGDEVAIARADADWAAAQSQMSNDLYERRDAARERDVRIARIKAENPAAPEEIFQGQDLEQIERAAKAVQAVAGQHQQRTGSWSQPPASSTAGGEPEPRLEDMTPMEREEARRRELDEVSRKVMRNGRHGEGAMTNAEKMMELALQPLINREALQGYRTKQEAERREGRLY